MIRTVDRAEIRRHGLRHRAVYVVVRTTVGGLVVHRRADWKDVYPGAWDIAFGGVLASGEDWDAAAARELAEEAGVAAPVTLLAEVRYDDADTGINGRVYTAVHDGPYPCPDGEVVETRVIDVGDLPAFLATHHHCPDSAEVVPPLLG